MLTRIDMGIIFLDSRLRIRRFNPAATRISNLIEGDIGRPISHIVSNLRYEHLVQDAQTVLDSLAPREAEVQSRDGRWYSMRIQPYRTVDNIIEGVMLTFNDITEQKEVQTQLSQAQGTVQMARDLAENIVNMVRDPLLVLAGDLRVVSANLAFYTTFQLTPEETVGQLIYELGQGQWDIPKLRELLEEIIPQSASLENFELEFNFPAVGPKRLRFHVRQIEPAGGQPPLFLLVIEEAGKVQMTPEMAEDKFATLRQQAEDILGGQPANLADLSPADIQALIHNLQVHQIELELQNEELRRTQLDLRAARDRYVELYNFAPVGYFTLDANGAIVETNLTGAALLNVARSALIGALFTRFVVTEDREKYAVYRVGLGASEGLQVTEVKLTRQAGAPFFAQLEGLAAFDRAGHLLQCKLVVSDISERVRAEEVTLQASRLEVTMTLASGIAHDINNLMTAVLGNAELLNLNLNQPQAADMLTAISRSALRASELAQQMLAFARGGKYQPRRMALNDAIQQALQYQQHPIPGSSLIIEQQLAADLWSMVADASQMSQVIVNLLTNAVEASDSKGDIRISTANLVIDEPGTEGICKLTPGRYVKLLVADRGCGMSAEVLAKVFEPFFTTKFQGRGMGLAAVYGIIQNHGGDISIKSEAGHGTVVRVYLPAVEDRSDKI